MVLVIDANVFSRVTRHLTQIYMHTQMQARVCFTFILGLNLLIVEDPTVTVKCGTAIKALFLYMNLYLYVMLDSLSFSFISIPSLINQLYFKNEFAIKKELLEFIFSCYSQC